MKISLLFLMLAMPPLLLAGEDLSQWTYRQELKLSGNEKYYRWEIPSTIYAVSGQDFRDIRIIDENGNRKPWFLEEFKNEKADETTEYSSVETGRSFNEESQFPWIRTWQIELDEGQQVNRLQLSAGTPPYSFRLKLYGRDDKGDWNYILQDSVYENDAGSKDRVDFPEVLNYRHYKLETDSDIDIEECRFVYSATQMTRQSFIRFPVLSYSVEQEPDRTKIIIENPSRLPISMIAIEAEGPYHRDLEWNNTRYTVEQSLNAGTIQKINGNPDTAEEIQIILFNGSNAPLSIRSVSCAYSASFIVFPGAAKQSLTLYAGNPEAEKLQYDLIHFKDEILANPLGTAEAGIPVYHSGPEIDTPQKGFPWNIVFPISMVLVAIVMIFVVVKVLRSSPR